MTYTTSKALSVSSENDGCSEVDSEMTLTHAGDPPQRDGNYYYSLVTFSVQGCLFRVPRLAFERESDVFAQIFESHAAKLIGGGEGESDENPVQLRQVSADAFRDLLSILYPLLGPYEDFRSTPKKAESDILEGWSKDRLLAVLELAHMWNFSKVKEMVVECLRWCDWDKDIVSKILVAQKYEINSWLAPTYERLVRREESLTLSEMESLGLPFVSKITKLRERRVSLEYAIPTSCACKTCKRTRNLEAYRGPELQDDIEAEFEL